MDDVREADRSWWRIPPRDEAEARVRWIGLAVVLSTVLTCAPPLIARAEPRPLMIVLLAVLTASLLIGRRTGRVPVAMDVLDALCFTLVLMISAIPLVGFGIGFQTIWYRCLYSSGARNLLRALLFLFAYSAGPVLWWNVQAQPNPDIFTTALTAGFFTTVSLSIFGWQLAESINAREFSSRRERLIAETGTRLLGATDGERIRQTGWQALESLASFTPGLRVARLIRTSDGLNLDRTTGFPHPPPPGLTSIDRVSELDGGCGWEVLAYDEIPDVSIALGHPGRVPPDVVSTAGSILNQVVLAHRNSETHAELVTQALTDPLTGLANRQGFTEATARLLSGTGDLSVMFIDLDDFKDVNDNLGHAAGDDLLVRVAAMLRSLVRDNDVVARLGGDEFAVLLKGIDERTAGHIAERIVLGLSTLTSGPAGQYAIGASIGLVHSDAQISLPELLVRADVAMYRAKAQGKGRMQTWQPELSPHSELLGRA
ncbi:GGDEF domain-containing protein [Kineosporia babensis]|uniref:GGDEF domain-containing protein n=1 Tax=Kineosporia babensis TaxID=499548 RepID=A0A9X1SUH8_9ACTN|nr:GGDEF domain-containing protein [Kineosporia babensis]